MKAPAIALACGWLMLCSASTASAFQDPMRFGSSAMEAGGGGRYFTGSPADGFGCTVCHKGYDVPVQITGLPDGVYTPGQLYRIVIAWNEPVQPVGLNAEVTDRAGKSVGVLSTPSPDELVEADLCEPIELGMPNAGVLPVPTADGLQDRQLAIAFACGARQATFTWQAPVTDEGPVWFAGSLVASDELGTLDGDGVADFAHVFGSPSAPDPLAVEIGGARAGCSLTSRPGGGPAPFLPLLVVVCVGLCSRSSKRHRRTPRGA